VENDVLRMMAVDITEGPALGIGTPKELFEGPYMTSACRGYDVTLDGQQFLMVDTSKLPPHEPVTHINVVLDWFEELKRRVPVD
jgi:hypothetical protein